MFARRGVLIFVLLVAVLGTAVLLGALSLRGPAPAAPSAVLVFDVPTTLEEAEPPALPFPLGRLRGARYTLYGLVDALHRAADDDHVSAMVVHVDGVDWGWAKLEEVRDALQHFRESGKPLPDTLAALV